MGTFVWSPNSSKIFYSATDEDGRNKGQNVTWSITVAATKPNVNNSGKQNVMLGVISVERITRGYDDDFAFAPDGKTLFFTRMSIRRPSEIQKLTLPAKIDPYDLPEGEQLTHVNDALLAQVDMSPIESYWFEGAEKAKVQGFLIKPPNFDPKKKYPVKLLIHGGPQGAWGDDWSYRWNAELFAANGYVVLQINPRGSTGYGKNLSTM